MMHNAVCSRLRDPPPQNASSNAATKAAFSASLTAAPRPITYDQSFYEKPHSIRRQLFWIDQENRMYPRYPSVPEVQKDVIDRYVAVHGIPREAMLDFWAEYVDCLLRCHHFEEEAPAEFRAWAYGRYCRYALLERTKRATALLQQQDEYDPVHNYSTRR